MQVFDSKGKPEEQENKTARKALSKKLRFEVFKRDSFQCQYCGSAAPQVILHVDHIEPVAKGGTNEIANLITSCATCNSGKSDRCLSDDTAVARSKKQLDDLQERREQIELMMEWQKGLRHIDNDLVNSLANYWNELTPGWSVNTRGKMTIKKLTLKFSVDEICRAMDAAAIQYLQMKDDGNADNVGDAFSKIGGICRINRESKANPDIKDLFYIRGILRKRIAGYFDEPRALQWLKNARSWGVEIDDMRAMAKQVSNWTQFRTQLSDLIGNQKEDDAE